MAEKELDLREIPPAQRHPKIFHEFDQLDSGESLTLVNDHEPRPLYFQMKEEVASFDADNYSVVEVADNEFIAELPKK